MDKSRRTVLVVDESTISADVLSAGLSSAHYDIHGVPDFHEVMGTFMRLEARLRSLGVSPSSSECMNVLQETSTGLIPMPQVIAAGSCSDSAFCHGMHQAGGRSTT